jgi:hypothetical protein
MKSNKFIRVTLLLVILVLSFGCYLKDQEIRAKTAARVKTYSSEKEALGADLTRATDLLTSLFNVEKGSKLIATMSFPVIISAYSLSKDECDEDPLMAAHGKSRPFMAAFSRALEDLTQPKVGDRFAVISEDGRTRAVVVYWDRMAGSERIPLPQIDIVAPAKEVAKWHGVKVGRVVKLVWKEPTT